LLALQLFVCFRPFHGFVTVNFSGTGLLAPRPTPNPEDHGLHFVWPLPFVLFGKGESSRSSHSRQYSSPCHWGAQTSSPCPPTLANFYNWGTSYVLFANANVTDNVHTEYDADIQYSYITHVFSSATIFSSSVYTVNSANVIDEVCVFQILPH
jgi:hypothetical protein